MVILCAGVGACSSPSPPASSQASTPARPPATPDPCTLPTYTQLDSAYGGDGAMSAAVKGLYLMTSRSDYDPPRDETGMTLSCSWSVPSDLGPASLPVLDLGGLAVKDGFFNLYISDYASTTPDLAVERQLAADAIAELRWDAASY